MTTILQNVGILGPDNKVTDAAFNLFVADVKKALQEGGSGIFPIEGLECSKKLEPTPGAELFNLEDKATYPDFHLNWRDKYTKMAVSIDGPGSTPLAPFGIFDPTAVAVGLNLNIKNTPDISTLLGYILVGATAGPPSAGLAPVMGLTAFDADLAKDPKKLFDMVGKLGSLPTNFEIPLPPLISIPDQNTGYSEMVKFDYLTQLAGVEFALGLLNPSSNISPLNLANLPKIAASLGDLPNLPKAVIEFVCKKLESGQPPPMESSNFEDAAQQTLLQHSVKLHILVASGKILGNGQLIKHIARNPITNIGLDLKLEPPDDISAADSWVAEVPSSRPGRKNISAGLQSGAGYVDRQFNAKGDIQTATRFHQNFRDKIRDTSYIKTKLNKNLYFQIIHGIMLTESGGAGYGLGAGAGGIECTDAEVKNPGVDFECVEVTLYKGQGGTEKGHVKKYKQKEDPKTDPQGAKKSELAVVEKIIGKHLGVKELQDLLNLGPCYTENPRPDEECATFHRAICALRRRGTVGGFCLVTAKMYENEIKKRSSKFDLGNLAIGWPDQDEMSRGADNESLSTYTLSVYYSVQDVCFLLKEPWAMPLGNTKEAIDWFHTKYGYKYNPSHVGAYRDANTGWQPQRA